MLNKLVQRYLIWARKNDYYVINQIQETLFLCYCILLMIGFLVDTKVLILITFILMPLLHATRYLCKRADGDADRRLDFWFMIYYVVIIVIIQVK